MDIMVKQHLLGNIKIEGKISASVSVRETVHYSTANLAVVSLLFSQTTLLLLFFSFITFIKSSHYN